MHGQTATDTSSPARRRLYPITREAFDALSVEISWLEAAIHEESPRGVTHEDDGVPSPLAFPDMSTRAKWERLAALQDVLAGAEVVRARGVAAIGRRVTISEADGSREDYGIVLPGDGDPFNGWISADSPIGVALLGATAGRKVTIDAPAGRRTVRVLGVRDPRPALASAPRPDRRES